MDFKVISVLEVRGKRQFYSPLDPENKPFSPFSGDFRLFQNSRFNDPNPTLKIKSSNISNFSSFSDLSIFPNLSTSSNFSNLSKLSNFSNLSNSSKLSNLSNLSFQFPFFCRFPSIRHTVEAKSATATRKKK